MVPILTPPSFQDNPYTFTLVARVPPLYSNIQKPHILTRNKDNYRCYLCHLFPFLTCWRQLFIVKTVQKGAGRCRRTGSQRWYTTMSDVFSCGHRECTILWRTSVPFPAVFIIIRRPQQAVSNTGLLGSATVNARHYLCRSEVSKSGDQRHPCHPICDPRVICVIHLIRAYDTKSAQTDACALSVLHLSGA